MSYESLAGWTPGGREAFGLASDEGASGGAAGAVEKWELEPQTGIHERYRSLGTTPSGAGKTAEADLRYRKFDRAEIARALEILDDLDHDDEAAMAVQLADLAGTLCGLWETAYGADQWHKAILALAEGAATLWKQVSPEQMEILKQAVEYLSHDVLTDTHVSIVRDRFIRAGYNPLAILGGFEGAYDDADE
jgi:hypothetical protein